MGWTPSEVRQTTLGEFNAAVRGWARANGAKDPEPTMSQDELAALMAWDKGRR